MIVVKHQGAGIEAIVSAFNTVNPGMKRFLFRMKKVVELGDDSVVSTSRKPVVAYLCHEVSEGQCI